MAAPIRLAKDPATGSRMAPPVLLNFKLATLGGLGNYKSR